MSPEQKPPACAAPRRAIVTVVLAHMPPRKHRDALAEGRSPANGRPLATCGDCVHLSERTPQGHQPVLKCALAHGRHGGPDVRPSWPACQEFQRAERPQARGQVRAA